jgi:6-phosphogluconate dehydrogenase
MKIGIIGLGKMGAQIAQRLMQNGHEVIGYNRSPEPIEELSQIGLTPAKDPIDLVKRLGENPVIWLMIPHEVVEETIDLLLGSKKPGMLIVDGGNSDFRLSMRRGQLCAENNVDFVDCGVSGGVHGLKDGFSIMSGGSREAFARIESVIKDLSQTNGYGYFGSAGAGHFVKMVHNAIEYGMMQSYAEGYRLLKEGPFEELDLAKAALVWQNGSIITSGLNNLALEIFSSDQKLESIEGYVAESGEARWALETSKEHNIDMPVIQTAFDVRVASQNGQVNFGTKFLAALRNAFGGHAINKDS